MFLLLACATPEAPPAAAPAAPTVATPASPSAPVTAAFGMSAAPGMVVGADFTAGSTVTTDQLVADAASWNGKTVTVEATVREVCQKKGCWHTLATADPAVAVMVKDKEYAMFLPKDSAGKLVHVHGTFALTEMPEAEARHYAEDAGKDPATVVGPQKSYQIDVAGVRFL